LNLAGDNSQVTDTLDILSGGLLTTTGVGILISGKLSGQGGVKATGGDLTMTNDNTDYTGPVSVRSEAGSEPEITVSAGDNDDYPGLGNASSILLGGGTLNLQTPVQQVPQNFAAFASFALPSIKKISLKVVAVLGKSSKITVKNKLG